MNYIVTDRNDADRNSAIIDVLPTREAAERLVRENGYGEIEEWENAEDCLIPDMEDFIQNLLADGRMDVKAETMNQYYIWLPKQTILDCVAANA